MTQATTTLTRAAPHGEPGYQQQPAIKALMSDMPMNLGWAAAALILFITMES